MTMPADLTIPKGLTKTKAKIFNEMRVALHDIGDFVVAEAASYPGASANSSYRRTGTLGRSISMGKVKKQGAGYSLDVGTNVPYAPHVEYGTGIHGQSGVPITPKTKPMLAWMATKGPMAGSYIFAKSVKGIKGWHFMQKALTGQATQQYARDRYILMVKRVAATLG